MSLVNDADAAGLAEVRWGAGRPESGVVLMLTLGTGNRHLLLRRRPAGTEPRVWTHRGQGKDAEHRPRTAPSSVLLELERVRRWLDEYLHRIEFLLRPDLIVIGGGISKCPRSLFPHLTARTKVVAAEMHNNAGIAGAALAGIHDRAAVQTRRESGDPARAAYSLGALTGLCIYLEPDERRAASSSTAEVLTNANGGRLDASTIRCRRFSGILLFLRRAADDPRVPVCA